MGENIYSHAGLYFTYFKSSAVHYVVGCMLLQLHRAVMDHVSDLFLETSMPLLVLIEAAKAGNEQQVEEFAQLFHDHANKLVEVLLTHFMLY